MSMFNQIDEIPRKVLTLFYLIDTSGSMHGEKIASLNVAVRETLPMISEISANNSDAKIKLAAMDFATTHQWMHPIPVESEKFHWRDLEASGLTNLGEAYQELNNKLSRSKGFMDEASGSYAPAIILMSDGGPTDDADHGLQQLKVNPWFKAAIKVAIAAPLSPIAGIIKNPFISIGSNIILTIEDTIKNIKGLTLSPTALSIEDIKK